jgi:ATP-dependent DNA helicase RecQ
MERIDLTTPAQKYLSCVLRTGQMFGEAYIIDVLRGSHRKKILDNGHDRLSTHGIGTDYSKAEWRHLSLQFLQHKLLERDARHGSLSVTQKGWGVLNRGNQFWGFRVEPVNRVTPKGSPEYSPELFELLRTERDKIAAAEGVLSYEVFHDKALQAMAAYFPTSEESFRLMPGVGPARSEKYAEVFLPIIREYFKRHGTYSAEGVTEALNILETTFQEPHEYALELFERLPY